MENLQKSRTRSGVNKCLPQATIEENLERMLQVNGEKGLNAFRDKARVISQNLQMETEFSTLNSIISALLATHSSNVLTSNSAIARARNIPYDLERVRLFETLFEALHSRIATVIY